MTRLSDRTGHFGKDYVSCLSISRRHARARDETNGLFERPISSPPHSNSLGGEMIKVQHGSLGIKCNAKISEPTRPDTPAAAESFTAFFPHMRGRNAADFLGVP